MDEPLTNEHGFRYYDEKPEEYVLCKDIKEFLTLRPGTKVWKKDNIRIRHNTAYLIHNPCTEVYWCRELHKQTNLKTLNEYIKDGNIYILKNNES